MGLNLSQRFDSLNPPVKMTIAAITPAAIAVALYWAAVTIPSPWSTIAAFLSGMAALVFIAVLAMLYLGRP